MLGFQNTKGTVLVENSYIAQLASYAASQCFGVVKLSGGCEYITDKVLGSRQKRGVEIFISEGAVSVKLHICVSYGINISAIAKSIVQEVRYKIEQSTGFTVKNVDVYIRDIR